MFGELFTASRTQTDRAPVGFVTGSRRAVVGKGGEVHVGNVDIQSWRLQKKGSVRLLTTKEHDYRFNSVVGWMQRGCIIEVSDIRIDGRLMFSRRYGASGEPPSKENGD